ncbi:MAG: MBL fold metallo-hydrolase [Pseudohongiellaceae bacterium]
MTSLTPSVPIDLQTGTTPVQQIVGRNPGPMTGPGTNSYLIGAEVLCLLDPGPADAVQLEVFLNIIGERELRYILVTHTHRDHSPGAAALQQATGAAVVGLPAPAGAGHDKTFKPGVDWQPGDEIDCGEYQVRLIHTPGHASNHICYLLLPNQLLFTGDHVLEGTTSVILPPDGDMNAYLTSLQELRAMPLRALAPGHGRLIDNPQQEIDGLIAHRQRREDKIVASLRQLGPCREKELVKLVYDDVAKHLIPLAMKTQLAHLIKLNQEGRATQNNEQWQLII